ncbi:Acetyltransferase (GNAT) family protein [Poriferisphaera corsica]|uniref:Acetyltransferase (GNAT) family protein n=1 Tax=Poriferisphaera corsica TaxID=2528020 RepID=A0A517YUP6_9BACT|nr:GNAT family N-acetyltransferase [Poriferisphaera corsica]QDU33936.1 Acetyltransferase (GNAT) family protein [Poriferisphaera corsica]
MRTKRLDKNFHIDHMTFEEFQQVILWAKHEGWNPGINDARVLYDAAPEGYLIGKIGEELVSSVTAIIYQKRYAFMGMYIVHPKYRGMGYGYAIWQEAMRRLEVSSVEVIAMEATLPQVERFQSSGFDVAYMHDRFIYDVNGGERQTAKVWDVTEESIDDVCAYDDMFDVEARKGFTRNWLGIPGVEAVYWSDKIHGEIKGYGVIREAAEGYRVGPLYAHDITIASEIFEALGSKARNGAQLMIDVPENNQAGSRLMRSRCGDIKGQLARMYKGGTPPERMNEMFGLFSVKIG